MKKIRISNCIFVILIITTSFLAYSIMKMQTQYNSEKLDILIEQTDKQLMAIIHNLYHSVEMVEQITIAEYDEGDFETLDAIFSPLIENYGYRNVTILPNGIVEYVYPIEGNEQVIGDNVFEIPDRTIEAQIAMETREVIMSGPYELTQGGEAFIMRKAVYVEGEFWGFVAVVMDKSVLLDRINVAAYDKSDYRYQLLATVNGLDTKLISESEGFEVDLAKWIEIELPNGNWSFGIEQKNTGTIYLTTIAFLLFGYTLSFLVLRYIKKWKTS